MRVAKIRERARDSVEAEHHPAGGARMEGVYLGA